MGQPRSSSTEKLETPVGFRGISIARSAIGADSIVQHFPVSPHSNLVALATLGVARVDAIASRQIDNSSSRHMLWPMPVADSVPPAPVRRVRLFRNGRNQAIRIPREFELEADEATMRREGSRLIIEPIVVPRGLCAVLQALEPIDDELPDVDETLAPLDDIKL